MDGIHSRKNRRISAVVCNTISSVFKSIDAFINCSVLKIHPTVFTFVHPSFQCEEWRWIPNGLLLLLLLLLTLLLMFTLSWTCNDRNAF